MNVNYLISIVPAIALLVMVIGWFVNNWFTRRHEVAKRRADVRVDVLKSFMELSKTINFRKDQISTDKILDINVAILTYGYPDEMILFEKFRACWNDSNLDAADRHLKELTNLARSRIRKELGLPNLKRDGRA